MGSGLEMVFVLLPIFYKSYVAKIGLSTRIRIIAFLVSGRKPRNFSEFYCVVVKRRGLRRNTFILESNGVVLEVFTFFRFHFLHDNEPINSNLSISVSGHSGIVCFYNLSDRI